MTIRLATFIDGNEFTTHGELMTRHGVACSVKINALQEQELLSILEERTSEEVYATDEYEMVPWSLSTGELSDLISDHEEDDWIKPYLADLKYMAEEDPCGMGIVYLLKVGRNG